MKRWVIVTPLLPPFEGKVSFFDFEDDGLKTLAVSHEDGKRILALLHNAPEGRDIVISAVGRKLKLEAVLQ